MSKFKPTRGSTVDAAEPEASTKRSPSLGRRLRINLSVAQVASPANELLAAPQPSAEILNPTREFAFNCTLFFLFFRFSFVHEFVASLLGIDTHILVILGVVCYGAWFIAGDVFAAFREKLARIWLAFVFCMCLATVTSIWRGGSFAVLSPYLRTTLPVLLLIPAVVRTPREITKVMNTIGLAGTATILFGVLHRNLSDGRANIGSEGSSIQDPNDLAAHLIMLLPAVAFLMFAKGRSIFVKAFGVGILAIALMEILSTGSRGGLVGLMVTALYIAYKGSMKIRLGLFVGVPLLIILVLPFVPKESSTRLYSLFDSSSETDSAAESTEARRALLKASLDATIHNPLFGVGPGVFMIYQAGSAAEAGQKGMWHETHNGYTQLSSECGIPAVLLFLSAIVVTMKSLAKAAKTSIPGMSAAAGTLSIMTVAFCSTLVFLAQGYRFTMISISAITVAINLIVAQYPKSQVR